MGCVIISQHFFCPALIKMVSRHLPVNSVSHSTLLCSLFFFLLNTKHFDKSAPTSLGSICPSVFCLFSNHSLPLSIFSSLSLQLYYSLLSCLHRFRQAERRMTVLKQQKDECVLKEEKTRHYMGAVLAAAEHISNERDQLLQMVPLLHGHDTQITDIHEFNLHGNRGKSPQKIIKKGRLHQEKHLVQTSCLFKTFNMRRSDFSTSAEASC